MHRSTLAAAVLAGAIAAQSPPPNGPRHIDPRWHALVHATLVPAPGQQVDDACIVLRDGIIVAVEAGAAAPAGARVWDCRGRFVYAGLVEPHLAVDAPAPKADAAAAERGARVMPQRRALDGPGPDQKTREELRALGFAAAALAPKDGVFRGTAALVLLAEPSDAEGTRHLAVVRDPVYQLAAFDHRGGGYPDSLMGAVALVRQTLLDAQRHARNRAVHASHPVGAEPPPSDEGLEALHGDGREALPLMVDCSHELDVLAAIRVAREMGRAPIVLGSGTEFRRLAAIAEDRAPLVLPLAFPEPPDVKSLAAAEQVALRDLMTWEQAPTNPRRAVRAGLEVALSTHRLERRADFRERLRRALRHGLTADEALAMLTLVPARLLGAGDRLGTVEQGKLANLVVADGPLFAKSTRILEVWVRGQRQVVHDAANEAAHGAWVLESESATLRVGAKGIALERGDATTKAREAVVAADRLDFALDGDAFGKPGVLVMHAVRVGDVLHGEGRDGDGARFTWRATRAAAAVRDDEPEPDDASDAPEPLPTPFEAFGQLELTAEPEYTVIHNATLWGARDGRIENGTLILHKGHIPWCGRVADAPLPPGARVIDATGKHVTPGLIDCHSHTGVRGGVNEGGQVVTAEVRVLDALDPDDVNWYRQLAGGVTMVNQLHGSSNPIGGQSCAVKLRWGVPRPEDMVVRGAAPGIKFALGENVKRAGDPSRSRYPATRMGVEALLRDRFAAARDYAATWQRWQRLAPDDRQRGYEPRRDLELEALAEVLAGLRLVHCHSYRQDEILMLCRLAEEFGFKIGTFQHGLEAYKVADVVRAAARGASVFSDWWAYKPEAYDAIPHNGSILRAVGVAVSFNSDSNELARRLNAEAAKAVKYGGTPPEAAFEFVTRGPAFQLGLDHRTGALEISLEGDVAIWSASPLSAFARCEATFVDGRECFSLERDRALRERARCERNRLVQKILRLGKSDHERDQRKKGEVQR